MNQRHRNYLLSLALLLLAAAPQGVFAADGEFTNRSIAGKYAIVLTGGGGRTPTAGIGVVEADADGNLEGETIWNVPGDRPGERKFIRIPLASRYEIRPDGTGRITPLICSVTEATFVIARAERRLVRSGPHVLTREQVALEIFLLGRELAEPEQAMLTARLYRLPDGPGSFTNDSFNGDYSLIIKAEGGAAATAAAGLIQDKTGGVLKGTLIFNIIDPQTGRRTLLPTPTEGSYAVNPDGTGRITFANGIVQEALFVITRARQHFARFGSVLLPGRKEALEFTVLARELGVGGHLLTGVGTLLPE